MRYLMLALIAAVAVAGIVLTASPVEASSVFAAGIATMAADLNLLRATSALTPIGIPMMAPKTVEEIQAEQQELVDASQAILAKADDENREPTEDEETEILDNKKKLDVLARQISLREAAAPVAIGAGRKTSAEPKNANGTDANGRRVPASPRVDNARGGFRRFGEFAQCVQSASLKSNPDVAAIDRLTNAATTYGNEGTGADGGFLVPPEFRKQIWQKVMSEENLLTRCDQMETSANNMTVPKDETTPWQNSGGVQAYWEAEGALGTESKGVFETASLRLNKLFALVKVTEELLSDAPGLESWLRAKAPSKMVAKINTSIVSGTGAGQPLGILNAPSIVSVAKQTSQPADTVWMKNIENMWARMYAPCRRNAIWLINQDIEPSLGGMAFQAVGGSSDLPGTSAVPAYLPPNGLSASPYGTLKGRPVVPVQACKTIGDKGDIILVDLTQYMILTKAGQDIKTDVSIHLHFDQDISSFRFIFRVNGQPYWGSAITPENGSNTLSWATVIDAR